MSKPPIMKLSSIKGPLKILPKNTELGKKDDSVNDTLNQNKLKLTIKRPSSQ